MPDELQTSLEETEQTGEVTPQVDPEPETPQTPTSEVTEQTPPEAQPDPYKEKFVNSQRESILNAERVKVANARLEQLTKQDTPTDEAMRQLYPEWDDFNQVTKTALIKAEAAEMRQRKLEARQAELDERLRLEDEIESVIDNPKFAKLQGREAEFKRFALNPKNRGINAEVLAQAFLFDASDEATVSPTQTTPKATGEALPSGSGGPREPMKPKKISLEEARVIRKTDYKRWLQLVKDKQIEDDI